MFTVPHSLDYQFFYITQFALWFTVIHLFSLRFCSLNAYHMVIPWGTVPLKFHPLHMYIQYSTYTLWKDKKKIPLRISHALWWQNKMYKLNRAIKRGRCMIGISTAQGGVCSLWDTYWFLHVNVATTSWVLQKAKMQTANWVTKGRLKQQYHSKEWILFVCQLSMLFRLLKIIPETKTKERWWASL